MIWNESTYPDIRVQQGDYYHDIALYEKAIYSYYQAISLYSEQEEDHNI